MARIEALLDKLCKKPTPADFRFSDLRKIMNHFGYLESNKGATSGNRQFSCSTNHIPEMKWQKRQSIR